MKLALYTYWRSSCSYRVRIVLAAKGLAYEARSTDLLARAHGTAEYLAENPMGYVPCLIADGRTFVESSAIVEFLDERFPTPRLLPQDAEGRADVRALVQIVNSGTQPLQNLNVLQRLSEDAVLRKAWARHFIEKGLSAFEALMARFEARGTSGRFAYGEDFSLADVFLVPQAYNARRFDVDLAAYPRISRALLAAEQHPAVLVARPEAQPDRPSDAA